MLDVEVWAKNKGFNCFYVMSRNSTVGFYKSCGYIVQENRKHGDSLTTLKKRTLKIY